MKNARVIILTLQDKCKLNDDNSSFNFPNKKYDINLDTLLHDDEGLTIVPKLQKDKKYSASVTYCKKCKVHHLMVWED